MNQQPDKRKLNIWNTVLTVLATLLIGTIWAAIGIFLDLKNVPNQFKDFQSSFEEVKKEWKVDNEKMKDKLRELENRIIKLEERTRNFRRN